MFDINAISSLVAPMSRAARSRERRMMSNSSVSPMRHGSARRRVNSATAATVRSGSGPVDALFRNTTSPRSVQGNSAARSASTS
ncbi:hypothetical protein [Gemmatirosa kalamazoonensis]|uniref:hypothetical protein n=1 Tax=Gemmatirosa kalamazoonensis TaxID=861299 RepID=UPI00130D626A|nr:hypothetical protein [Gemmatirosa kalamazoonensis]